MLSYLALSALPLMAAAIGTMHIENRCDFDVFAHRVSTEAGVAEPVTISAGATHTEEMITTSVGGVSIKMTDDENSLTTPMQIEYTQVAGTQDLFYNLSFVDCAKGDDASACAGHDGGLRMVCDGAKEFVCGPAGFCPLEAYYVPQPETEEPVGMCNMEKDVRVTLCG